MSGQVQFGVGSHHVTDFRIVEDSGFTPSEWAGMTEDERTDALWEWVAAHVEAWVEGGEQE